MADDLREVAKAPANNAEGTAFVTPKDLMDSTIFSQLAKSMTDAAKEHLPSIGLDSQAGRMPLAQGANAAMQEATQFKNSFGAAHAQISQSAHF